MILVKARPLLLMVRKSQSRRLGSCSAKGRLEGNMIWMFSTGRAPVEHRSTIRTFFASTSSKPCLSPMQIGGQPLYNILLHHFTMFVHSYHLMSKPEHQSLR